MMYAASARDAKELVRLGLAEPDACARRVELTQAYAGAGFEIVSVEKLKATQLRDLGTTWARRLWRDPERQAWCIVAHRGH